MERFFAEGCDVSRNYMYTSCMFHLHGGLRGIYKLIMLQFPVCGAHYCTTQWDARHGVIQGFRF
jgi:hypothetical protein